MAIDNLLYPEASNLAHTSEKAFYPVRIPVSHWQLRHYISTPEPDILYYASGHDIYCLNTATKKRKRIATLPFEARCTASGYGWVCVGGEDEGHFAAIKLDGSVPRSLDVDSALPISDYWRQTSNAGRRAASVQVERIGEEIVNSISIHRIQDEGLHLDDIVAVLTNNDKTVRIYSLPLGLETTVLNLPFAMNHATISPDGQTLVAVGDRNKAYFFQSEIQGVLPQIPKPHNRLTSSNIEWISTSVITLHIAGPEATTVGYFTTAWSPSGRLVAVGSEGGYITVFDTEILEDPAFENEDAIVAVIPSSRADLAPHHPGAVRSMMFSPSPWDLLIWAEDQGRVCIGDLRTGLKSKQVIHLEPKEEGLRKVVYEDVSADDGTVSAPQPARGIDDLEADFLRRYRNATPDNGTAVNFASEYIEARRRQRPHRQDIATLRAHQAGFRGSPMGLEDDPQGLTAREQQILENLRTTRQREEARSNGQNVTYTSPEMFVSGNRSSSSTPNTGESSSARPTSEIFGSVPDSFPELSRTNAVSPRPSDGSMTTSLAPLQALHENLRSAASRLPRRQASVVLTPPTSDPSTASSSALPTTSARPTQTMPAAETDEENPWRTIEDHMMLDRGPLFESAARAQAASPIPPSMSSRPSRTELEAELAVERARARSLARQRDRWRSIRAGDPANASASPGPGATVEQVRRLPSFPEGYETLLRRTQLRANYPSGLHAGVRTAGLAMSADGRTLWAACEEGIFELPINVKGRNFWPSLEPQ